MYAIFGATGQLGHLVIEELLNRTKASSIRAIGRDPAKADDLVAHGVQFVQADYDNPDSIVKALSGATRVLLISATDFGCRVRQHQTVIDAAVGANIEMFVYTSTLHANISPLMLAREHRQTENALKASGLPCVILRNGWYNENYAMTISTASRHGVVSCAGEGRISAASRTDYASAAARVLMDIECVGNTYELAGDESFTMSELADAIAQASGKKVTFTNISQREQVATLAAAGIPDPLPELLADSDAGAAKGGLFDESKTLSHLIGRATTPIAVTIAEVLKVGGR